VGQTGAGAQAAGGVRGGASVNPIVEVPISGGAGGTAGVAGATVVRTSVPDVTLPSASLFRTLADVSGRYLVETDPAVRQLPQLAVERLPAQQPRP
jgi:hypothetical protein